MNQQVCPCCSNGLIHHISQHRDYWFCRHCWQEMPAIRHKSQLTKSQSALSSTYARGEEYSWSQLIRRDKIKLKTV